MADTIDTNRGENIWTSNGSGSSGAIPPTDGADPAVGEVDFRELFSGLRRHLWLILAGTAIAVAIMAVSLMGERPLYASSAVVRLVDNRRALAGGIADAAVEEISRAGADPTQSLLQILQSKAVAAQVVDNHPIGLRLEPEGFPATVLDQVQIGGPDASDTIAVFFRTTDYGINESGRNLTAPYGQALAVPGLQFAITSKPAVSGGQLVLRNRDQAIGLLGVRLRSRLRKGTDILDLSFTGSEPKSAQMVLNAVLSEFQDYNMKRAQEQSKRRRLFVEAQLKQTDSVLAVLQDELSRFRSSHQLYNSDERISAEQRALLDLDARRDSLNAARQMYASMLSTLQRSGSSRGDGINALVAFPSLAANPVVAQLYTQLQTYQVQRDSLTTGRWAKAPGHPDVQRLDDLIKTTQQRLIESVRNYVSALETQIASLDQQKKRNVALIQPLPGTEADEARLMLKLETTEKGAERLRTEYQQARIAEAVEAGQVEIIDYAAAALKLPRRQWLKLTVAFVLGLLVTSMIAFLLEQLNTTLKRRDEIEHTLHLPTLAIIPRIAGGVEGLGARLSRLRRMPPPHRATSATALVTLSDARSSVSEAYRTMRTNLLFSESARSLKVIGITSPSPGEGKTTTSTNLAVTFAQQGVNVLLVDCDLRRAAAHTLFDLKREPGLTQVLLGYGSAADVVQTTSVPGLHVMTAGTFPPNPAEIIGSQAMRDFIQQIRGSYELIIVDCAPILVAADTSILSTLTDGVLLVVRAGRTERRAAVDALRQLRAVGARVLGAVLNDPDVKLPKYDYGGNYNYYYAKEYTSAEV